MDEEFFYHLQCGFAQDSKLFQLVHQPPPDLMFHENYAFFSGTSRIMQEHFRQLASRVMRLGFISKERPLVVELGCNDGILLRHFAERGIPHVGVEPSGLVAADAESAGISVLREFFDPALADRIIMERGYADVVLAANVMCHIPDIRGLAEGIKRVLKRDGILIFEDPYLGDVVRLGSYDQIYDEHVFLFSALSVAEIFAPVDLELIDVEPLATHGGSMRYTLGRKGRHSPSRNVAHILRAELAQGLDQAATFVDFAARVSKSASDLRDLLEANVASGRHPVAYGATSKSTTIYNYAKIGPELIRSIYDNTPIKQGKLSPGMHIPIVDELEFLTDSPESVFLAAWNHEDEIRAANVQFEARGGRWITHIPQVRMIDPAC